MSRWSQILEDSNSFTRVNIAQLKSWEEDTSFSNDLQRSLSHNCLSYNRSIDSSKRSSPQSAIKCFLFQFPGSAHSEKKASHLRGFIHKTVEVVFMLYDVKKGKGVNFFLLLKNKIQLDATYCFIMLMLGSTCFGHHYAHHQEVTTIALVTT